MSQSTGAVTPGLSANAELFGSVYKQVCAQAAADQQPTEVVLAQLIYHASYELFYSDGFTLALVQGVVEAAAPTVAREYEEVEGLEAGDAA